MKIAIFGNVFKKESIKSIKILLDVLGKEGIKVVADETFFHFLKQELAENDLRPIDEILVSDEFSADMALSIGGDGTFLNTACRIGKMGIPILGINTGRLGFLADISTDEIAETIAEIKRNEYHVEQRVVLKLSTDNPAFEKHPYALNEIAVLKQDSSSMISIDARINGEYVHTYQADGLIVATPTGSTAYSMSVGGPIVVPQAANIILSPVAPHSLNTRPLVIPDSFEIELTVRSRNNTFLLSLDGRSELFEDKYGLVINRGDYCVNVVKKPKNTFFNTLKNKLIWGADRRS